MKLVNNHKLNAAFVALLASSYIALSILAPKASGSTPGNIPVALVFLIILTVWGLWMVTCLFGLLSWLRLDRYARMLPPRDRRAYGLVASGVRLLAYGLLVSSTLTAAESFLTKSPGAYEMVSQINYYMVVIVPFVGFWLLRQGSRQLSVMVQATLSTREKMVTVGLPIVVMASFYIYLAATNPSPDALLHSSGQLGFIVLPINILLVVGAWTLGLLAALNIERATHSHSVKTPSHALIGLYNGILAMTGGFIILDAVSSLGTNRIAALPLGVAVALLYIFVGVVGLGFVAVAISGKELINAWERSDH